jgi:hypothetical protein
MSTSPNARRYVIALLTHARQVSAPERDRFASRLRADLGSRALNGADGLAVRDLFAL